MMYRIKIDEGLVDLPRPCEYFDLIGGTSTGGSDHRYSTIEDILCLPLDL